MPQDEAPVFGKQIGSSMACFMSACISDTMESPFQKLQSPFRFQEVATSPNELQPQQVNMSSPDDQIYCKQGLVCAVPNKCKIENPELTPKSFNESGHGPGGDFAKDFQPSYLCQDSSVRTTLTWDASHISAFNLDSQEVIHLDIFQETLPEERRGFISLNSSSDLEAEKLTEEISARDDHIFSNSAEENEQRLDFQSVQSRYKALKKTFVESQELPSRKQILRPRSEFSLTQTNLETNDMFSPLEKLYPLGAELVKKPPHVTLLERRVSLSPLVALSPVHPRDRSSSQYQGGMCQNLKG